MKKIISLLIMLGVAMPAMALETTSISATSSNRQNLRKDVREGVRERIAEKLETSKTIRAETKENIATRRQEIKTVRAETKENIAIRRQEIKTLREQSKKDLRVRLAKIKNTKKREAVERINDNIVKLNKKRTDHYSEVLVKLSLVLDRVEERVSRAESKGVDITNAEVAVVSARKSIAEAGVSIITQSEKIYTLAITDDTTLRQKVGETRRLLKDDLSRLHRVIKEAKESVRNAATTLAKTPRAKEAPEVVAPVATSTVNQ